jgi:hypothetical protein
VPVKKKKQKEKINFFISTKFQFKITEKSMAANTGYWVFAFA